MTQFRVSACKPVSLIDLRNYGFTKNIKCGGNTKYWEVFLYISVHTTVVLYQFCPFIYLSFLTTVPYLQLFVGGLMLYLRCLFAYSGVQHQLTVWVTWWVSYKRWVLLALSGAPGLIPGFLWDPYTRVARLFSFLCCVFFVFVLCLVYSMAPVSLDCCPLLIAPSVFSNADYLRFSYNAYI